MGLGLAFGLAGLGLAALELLVWGWLARGWAGAGRPEACSVRFRVGMVGLGEVGSGCGGGEAAENTIPAQVLVLITASYDMDDYFFSRTLTKPALHVTTDC